jgi:hypothetical protein
MTITAAASTPVTETEIRAAAAIYNADYMCPDLCDALAFGAPELDVSASPAGRHGSGPNVRVVITPGLRMEGVFIGAADPIMLTVPRRDGRTKTEDVARRVVRTRFAGVTVPVNVRTFI